MIHLGRRRNANEYCGAYGHDFTFREMKWLADWLLLRGCNLLIPHAFYYSVRGPRIDERPPDVGPNNSWWGDFKPFADAARRLCWLNTDCAHICEVAILGLNDALPWNAAKVCFQHQIDFNYIEDRHLWEDTRVSREGIALAGMFYRVLILEIEPPQRARPALEILQATGRLIRWHQADGEERLVAEIERRIERRIRFSPPHPDLRVRQVTKRGVHCFMLFNEGEGEIRTRLEIAVPGDLFALDAELGGVEPLQRGAVHILPAHAMRIMLASEKPFQTW
jgi:hypothetical protein